MFGFLANVLVNAVAIWVATLILPQVSISSPTSSTLLALVVMGAALAAVNAVVKPFVKAITGCLYLLTLGLIGLVVNALMLELAAWLTGKLHGRFAVDFETGPFFFSTIAAALVITVVSVLLNAVLRDSD